MYVSQPCRFCSRQRVMAEGEMLVCEKCRRDQASGEFVSEPDPLDELLSQNDSQNDGLAYDAKNG